MVADAFSRKIIGCHLNDYMSGENVVEAMRIADKNRMTPNELIHHSDRGLQNCSSVYQSKLRRSDTISSMTDRYGCYQNTLAEHINCILKREFLVPKCYTGRVLKKLT